jgi:hypothetical protein
MEQIPTPRTDNPDTASASTAAAPDSLTQEENDVVLQKCGEMMEETSKRVKDKLSYYESSVNEHAGLGAGVAELKQVLKESAWSSEELQGLLRELRRRRTLCGENKEEGKKVPLDEVWSMEYKA